MQALQLPLPPSTSSAARAGGHQATVPLGPCNLCLLGGSRAISIIPPSLNNVWTEIVSWSPQLDHLFTVEGRTAPTTTMFLCPNHIETYQTNRWTLALNITCLHQLILHELQNMQDRMTELMEGRPDPGRTFPPINVTYVYVTIMPGMQPWVYLNPSPIGQIVPVLPPGGNTTIAPWTNLSDIQSTATWQVLLMRSAMAFNTMVANPVLQRHQGWVLPQPWNDIKEYTVQLVAMYNSSPGFYIRNPGYQHVPPTIYMQLQNFNAGGGGQQANQQPNQGVAQQGTQQGSGQQATHGIAHASPESTEPMDVFRTKGFTRSGSEVEPQDWEGEDRPEAADITEPVATAEVLSKRPRTTGPFGSGSYLYRFAISSDFIYTPPSPLAATLVEDVSVAPFFDEPPSEILF